MVKLIHQLGIGWREDIKTILEEECGYRVQYAWFSGDSFIILQNSSSVRGTKALKTGVTAITPNHHFGQFVGEPDLCKCVLLPNKLLSYQFPFNGHGVP